MPFYNPYKKNPDWLSGISDIGMKVLQLFLLSKFPAVGGLTSTLGQTPTPSPKPMGGMEMFAGQGANTTMGGQGQNNFQITPEMIQKFLALLNTSGGMGGQFGKQRF